MQIKDFLSEIEIMAYNTKGDNSPEDVVDAFNEAIKILNKYKEKAQNNIYDQVEELVDSFGGRDCTMRQLKGE